MSIEIEIPKNFAVEEAGELRENILSLMEEGKKDFILNFHKCEFIDSTGLGVIVAIHKRTQENRGSLQLFSINPQIMKLFKLTRLDKVFEIH